MPTAPARVEDGDVGEDEEDAMSAKDQMRGLTGDAGACGAASPPPVVLEGEGGLSGDPSLPPSSTPRPSPPTSTSAGDERLSKSRPFVRVTVADNTYLSIPNNTLTAISVLYMHKRIVTG